ncbi:DUF998 domain-containing protein [Micromonospora sp. NPDC050495]|uniref:DUF998 domain-containing protein n=1 Tax=Micromonospora sp. NPDC050495 TaxID=3154936 RepID=UPI0033F1021E
MKTAVLDSPRLRDGAVRGGCTPAGRVTRSLLGYGVLAGPLYVVVSLAQALTRDGFDLARHDWSLLANGPGGWIQAANLMLAGVLVTAAAAGLWRAGGRPGRAAALLVGGYGSGLVGAGVFRADPMFGFPLGTPDGAPVHPTPHGTLHLVFGGMAFVCLAVACLLSGRRAAREDRRGRARWSRICGAGVLVGFAAAASGQPWGTLVLTAGVILGWVWLAEWSAREFARDAAADAAAAPR